MPLRTALSRCLALSALVFCLLPQTGTAQSWPTYSFVPIPYDSEKSTVDQIKGGLTAYAEVAELLSGFSGRERAYSWFDSVLEVDRLDMARAKQNAFAGLTNLMRTVALDAVELDHGKFPAPTIAPTLRIRETGEVACPVFWAAMPARTPARYSKCQPTQGWNLGSFPHVRGYLSIIQVNGAGTMAADFSYDRISAGYDRDMASRQNMLLWIGLKIAHELVHATQVSGFGNVPCADQHSPREWLIEGMADRVAHYLASLRRTDVFEALRLTRNTRRFDLALGDDSLSGQALEDLQYDAGAFFRYLMEATETGGKPGLPIIAKILKMSPQDAESDDGIYAAVDDAIGSFSGNRTLYEVLPEFMTEYASYGEGRYKSRDGGGKETPKDWHDRVFDGCVEYHITPGISRVKSVEIKAMAAECLHVKWSGFSVPVAMQLFVMDARDQQGDLPLGETFRENAGQREFCYAATRNMTPRLGRKSEDKCIKSAEPQDVSGASGSFRSIQWTSDLNMANNGEAFFVVTNIANDFRKTKDASVSLLIGATDMKSNNGAPARPVKHRTGSVVDDGITDIDSRVHALATVEGGYAVDGRFVCRAILRHGARMPNWKSRSRRVGARLLM